jgi:hypothetical protein
MVGSQISSHATSERDGGLIVPAWPFEAAAEFIDEILQKRRTMATLIAALESKRNSGQVIVARTAAHGLMCYRTHQNALASSCTPIHHTEAATI